MVAGMVLTNLLYVVGAIAVATVVSGFVLLRHRRPKSLEAGIEMFSRELKALQPDRPGAVARVPRPAPTGGPAYGGPPVGGSGTVRKRAVRVAGPTEPPVAAAGLDNTTRRNEAPGPPSDLEDGPG